MFCVAMKTKYYIWSIEHKAWWKKNSWGYTKKIEEAELYSLSEAKEVCVSRNGFESQPKVEMVAQSDFERIEEKISV